MIKGLEHVALGVRDIRKSLKFYRDTIGMKVAMKLDVADDRIGRVIGIPGAKCRIIHLRLGHAFLELFEYRHARGRNLARKLRQIDHGWTHIGFAVNNIHRHIRQLRKKKVEFIGEPVEFRPGVWVVYFRGPDGEVVEFRQNPEE